MNKTCIKMVPFAAKHKGRSEKGNTQETTHVFVEEQKKPRPTCYSAPTCAPLLFGSPYYIEIYRETMSGTMEEDGLIKRRW